VGNLGFQEAQQTAFVREGKFRSGPLYKDIAIPITGTQPLEITAYFNAAWQNKEVLAILGQGGKSLSGKFFELTDPDFIDSDKILSAKFKIALPPVSGEALAINTVKHAILSVRGRGRSATNIQENIAVFTQPGTGVKLGRGWRAEPTASNTYQVSWNFIDGPAGSKDAIWTVNMATKQVKYVNEAAKAFSWVPAD
jgi:hypothetical protein